MEFRSAFEDGRLEHVREAAGYVFVAAALVSGIAIGRSNNPKYEEIQPTGPDVSPHVQLPREGYSRGVETSVYVVPVPQTDRHQTVRLPAVKSTEDTDARGDRVRESDDVC